MQVDQEVHNSFITDHFLYFLNIDQARRPEGRSEGVWAAPSLKATRTPIEHDERSSSMWRSANPSKGAKASITRSLVPLSVSRAVQCRRSDRIAKNVKIAHDGMEAAADPPHGGRRHRQKISAPGAHFWPLLGT